MDTSAYAAAQAQNQRIASALNQLARTLAQHPPLGPKAAELHERAGLVAEGAFTILVVGSFSRGKSTLLNAIIGRDLLVRALNPSSAVISVLRDAAEPHAIVHFKPGHTPASETLSLDEFKARYQLRVVEETQGGSDRFGHVDYSEIFVPSALAAAGVRLVDSPGSEDSEARTERARDFVTKADAIMYLLDSTAPCTQADDEHLHWIAAQGAHEFFFVANKWDSAIAMSGGDEEELEQVVQRFRKKLLPYTTLTGRDVFDERFFRVSALPAMKARAAAPVDQRKLTDSGLPRLEAALQLFLTHDRLKARNQSVATLASKSVIMLADSISQAIDDQRLPLAELEQQRVNIQPKLEMLRLSRQRISEYLRTRVEVIHSQHMDSLRQCLTSIDTVALVEGYKLPVLDEWLARRGLTDLLRSTEDKLAAQLRRELESSLGNTLYHTFTNWERNQASVAMAVEAENLRRYLEAEAAQYEAVLREIDTIRQRDQAEQAIDVSSLIKGWVAGTRISKDHDTRISVDSSSIAIDFAPMLAGILAETLLHLKMQFLGHTLGNLLLPGVGTLITIVVAAWRDSSTKEGIRKTIADAVRSELRAIPTAEQSLGYKLQLRRCFDELEKTVAAHMDAEIARIDAELTDVIERKRNQQASAEAEAQRLGLILEEARASLTKVENECR